MVNGTVKIEKSWKKHLANEFSKPYFLELTAFIEKQYSEVPVYPLQKDIFRAFDLCPFDTVKVVILGQDPYHGLTSGHVQARGLAFAVNDGVRNPPSLQNIFKEIENDFQTSLKHTSGDLTRWAMQGVLLLNTTLTVQAHQPGSHQRKGWEQFTDAVIKTLSDEREHVVFILWGNYARLKGAHIDRTKHLVLESAHPSPLSASRGFFNSKPFSKTNAYLIKHNKTPIDWI